MFLSVGSFTLSDSYLAYKKSTLGNFVLISSPFNKKFHSDHHCHLRLPQISPSAALFALNTSLLTQPHQVFCFSELAHFAPLPTLPPAKEAARPTVHHAVHLRGVQVDVQLTRDPSLHQFCREFCSPAYLFKHLLLSGCQGRGL